MIAATLTLSGPVAAFGALMFTAGLVGGWGWRGDHEYHKRQAARRKPELAFAKWARSQGIAEWQIDGFITWRRAQDAREAQRQAARSIGAVYDEWFEYQGKTR